MWFNDLDEDHRRALNKYVGALTKFLNMKVWSELIEVLIGYCGKNIGSIQKCGDHPDYQRDLRLHRHSGYMVGKKSKKARRDIRP